MTVKNSKDKVNVLNYLIIPTICGVPTVSQTSHMYYPDLYKLCNIVSCHFTDEVHKGRLGF
jgi:hypothetical protein